MRAFATSGFPPYTRMADLSRNCEAFYRKCADRKTLQTFLNVMGSLKAATLVIGCCRSNE
ncbi:cellulose biosynthesis cyclic di-GMP-binding regulatory protein BcsB [Vibrio lentus]|nr:cellulose biosynthesis cyclic di-GMP-binding regulatory protein BcsB [Vibrio lentus]